MVFVVSPGKDKTDLVVCDALSSNSAAFSKDKIETIVQELISNDNAEQNNEQQNENNQQSQPTSPFSSITFSSPPPSHTNKSLLTRLLNHLSGSYLFFWIPIALNLFLTILMWLFPSFFLRSKLKRERTERIKYLDEKMKNSDSYLEWSNWAKELDVLDGKEEWRSVDESPYYDSKLIRFRLANLRLLSQKGDIHSLILALRAGLLRNLGGMGNVRLFQESRVGTKYVIEEYVDEVVKQLRFIHEMPESDEHTLEKRFDFFYETRQAFGRSALCLSGGATLAYDKTKRILNITVVTSGSFELPRLLNYLTAPNVLVWSAACASCALKFLFEPVELVAKDKSGNIVPYHPSGLVFTDGSVESDLPMNRLSELFNVNHFIVSQVNPHVIPFISDKTISPSSSIVDAVKYLTESEMKHRVLQMASLGLIPTRISGITPLLTQKYSGDITVVPDVELKDYANIISNPTDDMMRNYIKKGKSSTWSKIAILKNHCRIELTLDSIVSDLRDRLYKSDNTQQKHKFIRDDLITYSPMILHTNNNYSNNKDIAEKVL
ncbi:hypothetical protein PPL_05472 [Heterostelium album PN500]|uniref:PNPLA domain-containing protein n=1 Tax=Heterostelium pallidum (strain ATCC 26659 / Pp 5 / PN500) TaxID=670386 RepID=D3BA97_HETP5|nr:hypothetical protein PPL_05472 [Heterostelium album PN500]EFA81484.1 hypothetical protein PPL_05472 [Heterostelium album PN500]|eukprot:XP_020433602.1 hypothetical protein PPL_05472 [Heterostelium album PN500]